MLKKRTMPAIAIKRFVISASLSAHLLEEGLGEDLVRQGSNRLVSHCDLALLALVDFIENEYLRRQKLAIELDIFRIGCGAHKPAVHRLILALEEHRSILTNVQNYALIGDLVCFGFQVEDPDGEFAQAFPPSCW
jgi:hypothetical protein